MKTATATEPTPTAADQQASDAAAPALTLEELRERERRAWIAEHAYYLAMARGFAPGRELDDWLAAERTAQEARTAAKP